MKKAEKGPSLKSLFIKNAEVAEKAFRTMKEALMAFLNGDNDLANAKAEETILVEKEHDRIKEEVIRRLFSKESMVFSRPDRLNIIEETDKIVDQTEIVVRKLQQYSPAVPPEMVEGLKSMAQDLGEIGTNINQLIQSILQDFSAGYQYIERITDLRRNIREVHGDLLKTNYSLDLSYKEFYYYTTLVKALTKVADESEEFADEIQGLLCKYAM